MANEVRIKLTNEQKAKIKEATGKEMTELRVESVGGNPAFSPVASKTSARIINAKMARRAGASAKKISARDAARAGQVTARKVSAREAARAGQVTARKVSAREATRSSQLSAKSSYRSNFDDE